MGLGRIGGGGDPSPDGKLEGGEERPSIIGRKKSSHWEGKKSARGGRGHERVQSVGGGGYITMVLISKNEKRCSNRRNRGRKQRAILPSEILGKKKERIKGGVVTGSMQGGRGSIMKNEFSKPGEGAEEER